jgi:hypothetical protein
MTDRYLSLLGRLRPVRDDDIVAVQHSAPIQELLAAIVATPTEPALVSAAQGGQSTGSRRAVWVLNHGALSHGPLGHRLAAATASVATATAVLVAVAQGAH